MEIIKHKEKISMATPVTDTPQEIHEDELAGMGPGTIPEKPETK